MSTTTKEPLLLDTPTPRQHPRPPKVSETIKTAKPTALGSESSPLKSNNDPPISTSGTAKKEDRPSAAVVTSPPPNSGSKETGYKTSGTAGPPITISSINSWYDYINTYLHTAVPTIGAAVSARALKNAGVPQVGPAVWRRSMLKQLLRRRSGDEEIESSKVVGGAGNDKEGEGEGDEPSSCRVLAKPCPSLPTADEEGMKAPYPTTYLDETTPDVMASTQPSARPTHKPLTATKAASATYSTPNPETINFEFPILSTPSSHKTPTPTSSPLVSVPSSTNQTASETDTKVEPDADSVAWGKIHDQRMLWTVAVLWVLVGLQVVCGFWEFGKNVRGNMRVGDVGRVGWWDGKVRAAE
jgi:hypothetical protein